VRDEPTDPFEAGPFTRLHAVCRLPAPARRAGRWRRAIVLSLVAWIPLLLLDLMRRVAFDVGGDESFLGDLSAHVRYLIAIPLLVIAERTCLPRLSRIARQFERAELVRPQDRFLLRTLFDAARSQLDHRGAEVVLTVIAYALAIGASGIAFSYRAGDWISPTTGAAALGLSVAGWWCVLVSQPVFLVLWMAWLWRATVWARFLWGVSRLELRLVAAHPDQSAGLRFVSDSLRAFAPIGFALGAVVSGTMAGRMPESGQALQDSERVAAVATTALAPLCVFAGPLLVFVGTLRRVRRRGILEYGALAGSLGHRFEERWMGAELDPCTEALSAPDFSATTDLYSIVSNARAMTVLPFGVWDAFSLVIASLLPFLPLLLLVVPAVDVLKAVASVFL
jgi:hypothetical protein